MARRRFFADALWEGAAHLEGANAHHLARVLRAQPGQEYELAFEGRVYLARITSVRPQRVEFAVEEEWPRPPNATSRLAWLCSNSTGSNG